MNQERYWRNLIADEIKAEHDKVKKYYQKKGMNTGGMSPEEHTRLNIFLLCESISRTMKNSQDAPREEIITTPPTPHKVETDQLHSFIEEQIADNQEIPGQQTLDDIKPEPVKPVQDPVRNLVKDTPYQNEFGEIL
jgi:IMP dehydrogenase/GMP reductase